MFSEVVASEVIYHVAMARLNRPLVNAVKWEMRECLADILAQATDRDHIRVVGRADCPGQGVLRRRRSEATEGLRFAPSRMATATGARRAQLQKRGPMFARR